MQPLCWCTALLDVRVRFKDPLFCFNDRESEGKESRHSALAHEKPFRMPRVALANCSLVAEKAAPTPFSCKKSARWSTFPRLIRMKRKVAARRKRSESGGQRLKCDWMSFWIESKRADSLMSAGLVGRWRKRLSAGARVDIGRWNIGN